MSEPSNLAKAASENFQFLDSKVRKCPTLPFDPTYCDVTEWPMDQRLFEWLQVGFKLICNSGTLGTRRRRFLNRHQEEL